MARRPVRPVGLLGALVITGAATLVLMTAPAGATSVSDQSGFRVAWANVSETQIDLTTDITLTCPDSVLGNGVAARSSATAITLDGHGHTITQTCTTGTNNGVLESDGAGAVTIQNVTITGGSTAKSPGAGGVFADGPLTLSRCTVSSNQAHSTGSAAGGALGFDGTLTINGCTLSGNTAVGSGEVGGGAEHDGNGSLSITDSALTGNTATAGASSDAAGGVVNNGGSTTITRSSITSNHATGINVGGGVVNESGSETTVNSTISGNTASANSGGSSNLGAAGGILNQGGGETLVYDTLDGNTGTPGAPNNAANYVNQGGSVHFFGTSLGDPSGGPNCVGGSFVSNGHNLEDDQAAACGFAAATGDIVGQSPQLGAIANNGGPTLTQLPQPNSPLIDAIPSASCQADGAAGVNTDERGVSRPQGSGCDIGAVEVQAGPTQCVTGSHAGSVSLSGRNACVSGGSIGGSLVISSGTNATITNTSIGGAISASGGGTFTLCGSRVGGSLSVRSATGFVLVGDPGDDACAGNSIRGSAQFSSDHAGVEVGHNSFSSSLALSGNTGGGPFPEDTRPEVEANTIAGNLLCSSDTPAVTNDGQPNSVGGSGSGECVGL